MRRRRRFVAAMGGAAGRVSASLGLCGRAANKLAAPRVTLALAGRPTPGHGSRLSGRRRPPDQGQDRGCDGDHNRDRWRMVACSQEALHGSDGGQTTQNRAGLTWVGCRPGSIGSSSDTYPSARERASFTALVGRPRRRLLACKQPQPRKINHLAGIINRLAGSCPRPLG